jgi:phospholipid/cholesterol/gamma-HCH transport system substrate-binding protein
METRANYVIIGAFTFLVAVAAVLFGLFAARFTTDQAWDRYEILFTESVMGLSDGSTVLYNGVNVGRVIDIALAPDDPRQVLVVVDIQSDVPIHTDTVATLRLTGLTGTAAIQLTGGSPALPLVDAPRRGLPRIQSQPSAISRLLESSEGIAVTANQVLAQMANLIDDENIDRVRTSLTAIETFSADLNDPEHALNRMLESGATTGARLPELIERLELAAQRFTTAVNGIERGLVDELPELSEQARAAIGRIDLLARRLDRIVASNEDDLSRLGAVGVRQIDGGVNDLRRLIQQLSALVRELEQGPADFLLGGEQPEEYSEP